MVKKIELIEKNGRVQTFGIEHAVSILKLKNSVWSIPEKSEFQFVNDAITKKPGSKPNRKKTKTSTITKRGTSSK
jgi:hypothetical protein